MNLKFYMDQHVPKSITVALRQKGIDIITAYEDGSARLEDTELMDRVIQLDSVLFTQDKDFLTIATDYQRNNKFFRGIIFSQQKSLTIGKCIENLEVIAKAVKPEELFNQILFLPI